MNDVVQLTLLDSQVGELGEPSPGLRHSGAIHGLKAAGTESGEFGREGSKAGNTDTQEDREICRWRRTKQMGRQCGRELIGTTSSADRKVGRQAGRSRLHGSHCEPHRHCRSTREEMRASFMVVNPVLLPR